MYFLFFKGAFASEKNKKISDPDKLYLKNIGKITLNETSSILRKSSLSSDISQNVRLASKEKLSEVNQCKKEENIFHNFKHHNFKYNELKQTTANIEETIQQFIPTTRMNIKTFQNTFKECGIDDKSSRIAMISQPIVLKQRSPNLNHRRCQKDSRKHSSRGGTKILPCADRFDIPFSMIYRAYNKIEKQKRHQKILKTLRFSHMGYRQPPTMDDSSENSSIKNVKHLSLLQTPYFLVPAIKCVQRNENSQNIFLKKDRLIRIHILLNKCQFDEEINIKNCNTPLIKDVKLKESKTNSVIETKNVVNVTNPIKEKLFRIIRCKYGLQQRKEPIVSI